MQHQVGWSGRFGERLWALLFAGLSLLVFSLSGVGMAEDEDSSLLSRQLFRHRPDHVSSSYPLDYDLWQEMDNHQQQIELYRAEVNQNGGRPNWAKIWTWLKQDPALGMIFNPPMVIRIYQDQIRNYPGATLPEKFWHYAWRQLNLRLDEFRHLEALRPRQGRQALGQEVLRIMASTQRSLAIEDIDQIIFLEDMIALPENANYEMNDRRLAVVRSLAAQIGRFERPEMLSEGSWQELNGRLVVFNGESWRIPLLTVGAGQELENIIMKARQKKKAICRKLMLKKQRAPQMRSH